MPLTDLSRDNSARTCLPQDYDAPSVATIPYRPAGPGRLPNPSGIGTLIDRGPTMVRESRTLPQRPSPWRICPASACPRQARNRASQSGAGRLPMIGMLPHISCPTALGLMSNETDEACTASVISRFRSGATLTALLCFSSVSSRIGRSPSWHPPHSVIVSAKNYQNGVPDGPG